MYVGILMGFVKPVCLPIIVNIVEIIKMEGLLTAMKLSQPPTCSRIKIRGRIGRWPFSEG